MLFVIGAETDPRLVPYNSYGNELLQLLFGIGCRTPLPCASGVEALTICMRRFTATTGTDYRRSLLPCKARDVIVQIAKTLSNALEDHAGVSGLLGLVH